MTWRASTGEEWKEGSNYAEPLRPSPIQWYDRQGNPIHWRRAAELLNDLAYKIVARDEHNGYLISTVWLGLDMRFYSDPGPPLIFETMVFWAGRGGADQYCERYSTEAEALARHKEIVDLIKRGDWPDGE